MRLVFRLVLAGALAGGLAVVAAGPAPAGVDPSMDGRIAKSETGDFKGEGVFNNTGKGQTIRKKAPQTKTREYSAIFENVGGNQSDATIRGDGDKRCYRPKYFVNDSDQTAAVTGAGFVVATPPNGDQTHVTIQVKVKRCAKDGAVRRFALDASPSNPNPEPFDRVRAKIRVT